MNDAMVALVSAFLGAAISVVTQLVSHRREDRRERHEQAQRQLADLSRLYEEALFVLDRNARAMGLGSKETLDETLKLLARIQLGSTTEIREQYLLTAEALDAWADEARQGAPKPIGGNMVMIGSPDFPHQEKAKALYPIYSEAYDKLRQMMREHLASMRQAA